MNLALWIVQVLLAVLFVFAGSMKFIMTVEEMTKQMAMPGWFLHFIGVAEVLGGLGLVLPGLFRIAPGLTPLAAAGLVIIMIGATVIGVMIGPIPVTARLGIRTSTARREHRTPWPILPPG